MANLMEKLKIEYEKAQQERLAHEQNAVLDANNPANLDKIKQAKSFHRSVGAGIAAFGLAMCGVFYGFYVYDGSLYIGIALLGIVCLVGGLIQAALGKPLVKTK
jgi:hypothetical protein